MFPAISIQMMGERFLKTFCILFVKKNQSDVNKALFSFYENNGFV